MKRRTLLKNAALSSAILAAPSIANEKPLAGKSILITGASSGFGRLGALHYARLGAKVIASMRNLPRPEAKSLLAEAKAEKLDISVIEIDVTKDASVINGVAQAHKMNDGVIDILVNNAGVVMGGPVEMHDMEAARLQFDTNVYGYLRTIQAVLPFMRARKSGLIFNVSSQQGRFVMPGGGLYAPTKFAVEAMCEQLAYEVAPYGVDICIIQPGGYSTNVGVNRARYNKELLERPRNLYMDGYKEIVARMKGPAPTPAQLAQMAKTDPMDIPRAIAEIAAMPAGKRPLRRAVHPVSRPQEPINAVSREVALKLAENSPMGVWVRAVHD